MSDFNFNPDFVVEETIEYKTLISQYETGTEQRRRKWENPLRKWFLRFKTRPKSELEQVRDFFILRSGAYASFTWTNPNDSVEYTVRFAEDGFKFILKAYQLYDFELELVEVK